MADRVGDRLAEREGRIDRLVDALQAARNDPTGDRDVIEEEPLRLHQQIEGPATTIGVGCLPVIWSAPSGRVSLRGLL